MITSTKKDTVKPATQQGKTKTYLATYFLLSLVSWLLTNKAAAIASVWMGPEHFGDFSVSLRLAHNLAHLFVMGQESTILMYLSQYHNTPEKQSGLIRWIIQSTITKTVLLLSFVGLALYLPGINHALASIGLHIGQNYWLGFICIPFVVISGIYERYFMFLHKFFISFLARGIYQPVFFIVVIYIIQSSSSASAGTALILYATTYMFSAAIYALQGYWSPFSISKKHDSSDKKEWQLSGLFYTFSTLIIKSSPSIALLFLENIGRNELSVGHFSALLYLIYGFHLLTKPFDSYLKPAIAQLYARGEITELQNRVNYVNKIRWGIIAALLFALTLAGKGLLSQYGDSYQQSYPQLVTLSVLCAIQSMGQPANELLNYTGFQKKLSIIMALQFFLIAALSKALIPLYDIWGAVFAQGVPCVIATFASATALRRYTKIKAYIIF